ncbi:mucin-associated surface protein [Trypanosoma cruzi cruzi]|uniref:Mucin-associated surface protein (MASP) n=1 Tax=Trypanosoma cruzi TaxID=5693 RepID=A0A2V2VU98_TRYCR|nr:mucin-associated surface protein [Trypanosoma cruzi cruzi]PWU98798.1 Mucin-associated surface protein (MASP) [Trypanosoma cruzi]
MAMMMTGRVLLVCALCVLWCGAGGTCDKDATRPAGSLGASTGGVGERSQESQLLVLEGSQSLRLEAPDVKGKTEEKVMKVPLAEEESCEGEDEDEDEDELNTMSSQLPSKPQGGGGGGEVQKQNDDGKLKNANGNGPQPLHHQKPVQEEDTINGGHQLTQGKEQQTSVEEIPRNPAGDRSSGEHSNNDGSNDVEEGEEGAEGHERDRAQEREVAAHVSGAPKVNSTDIQQEVQRTHAGETPTGMKQRAGEEKDDETEEEREEQKEQHQENPPGKQETLKDSVTITMRNDTATPGDSDGSTAVSHTTSPLLLLILVACAAAAAVVAA